MKYDDIVYRFYGTDFVVMRYYIKRRLIKIKIKKYNDITTFKEGEIPLYYTDWFSKVYADIDIKT